MAELPSKRLRLRFFPEDERALDEALEMSSHTSMSGVIRGALGLLEQVWASRQGGFDVVYCREGIPEMPGVLDSASLRTRSAAEEGQGERRPRTEKSIEIRLTRADNEKIQWLLRMEAADTYSEVVRRSIRLYRVAIARVRDGWSVAAISPSGDVLPLPVPGAGSEAPVRREAAGGREARVRPGSAGNLGELLPRSLVASVQELAAREGCALDVLLVDMIRTETFARLTHREDAEPIAPVEAAVPIPAPGKTAVAVQAPVAAPDKEMVDQVAHTLEQMADNIEKVVQLVGETTRSRSQQAQLTDLFYDDAVESEQESVTLAPASNIERLCMRAEELNERLGVLVALTSREPKGERKRK